MHLCESIYLDSIQTHLLIIVVIMSPEKCSTFQASCYVLFMRKYSRESYKVATHDRIMHIHTYINSAKDIYCRSNKHFDETRNITKYCCPEQEHPQLINPIDIFSLLPYSLKYFVLYVL